MCIFLFKHRIFSYCVTVSKSMLKFLQTLMGVFAVEMKVEE